MSDDRIQRLTALARRVWPQDDPLVVAVPSDASVWLFDDVIDDVRAIHIISRPRALDALEAALLVLALPETGIESSTTVLDLCRANTELGMALVDLRLRLGALAEEWESAAEESDPHSGSIWSRCAAELRERAKEASQ